MTARATFVNPGSPMPTAADQLAAAAQALRSIVTAAGRVRMVLDDVADSAPDLAPHLAPNNAAIYALAAQARDTATDLDAISRVARRVGH